MLIASNDKKHADGLINKLKFHFRIKDLGKPRYTAGMHIEYNRMKRKLKLNQRLYIETIAKRFGPSRFGREKSKNVTKE